MSPKYCASIFLIGALAVATPATAVLTVDPADPRLTHDSITGLTWLDVDQTIGLSYDQVEADVGGWITAGFRHATAAEVCDLFNNYLPHVISPCPSPIIESVLGNHVALLGDYLGITRTFPADGLYGLYDDGAPFPDVGKANVAYNPTFSVTTALVEDDAVSSATISNTVGSFMVRAGLPVPDANTSTVPDWIHIVGTRAGVPAPGYKVTVVVRDAANNPIPGSAVIFDFSNMIDVRLCSVMPGIVNCAVFPDSRRVLAVTGPTGMASITAVGASINATGTEPGHGLGDGLIFANGVPLGKFTSPIFDQNGAVGGNGMTGADLALGQSIVSNFQLGGPYRGRMDINCDAVLSGADLAFMLAHLFTGDSASGCSAGPVFTPYCP